MTWNELPLRDWDSDGESPEEIERLNQIEQRLKAIQPTPPHLDAAAWERILAASDAPDMPEPETVPLAEPVRRRGFRRAAGTIAAVWLSGAVVGSSVMFLIMNREPELAQIDTLPPPVVHAPQEPGLQQQKLAISPKAADIGSQTNDHSYPLRSDTATVHSTVWVNAPAVGWEEPLRPFGHPWRKVPVSAVSRPSSQTSATRGQEPLQQSDMQRQLASSFVPPPQSTPQRILEDLMANGLTFVQPL